MARQRKIAGNKKKGKKQKCTKLLRQIIGRRKATRNQITRGIWKYVTKEKLWINEGPGAKKTTFAMDKKLGKLMGLPSGRKITTSAMRKRIADAMSGKSPSPSASSTQNIHPASAAASASAAS